MMDKRRPIPQTIQLVVSFVIPTIILLTLSDESKLGPLAAMFLALLPPLALEAYSLFTRRKPSITSLIAIVGIILIGVISLLGLSKEWLGVRRAAVYLIGAVAVVGVIHFKRDLLDRGLEQLIDTQNVHKAARKNKTEAQLAKHITRVSYLFAGLLLLLAAWSYVLTIIVITAPAGSSEFNTEYAKLRLLGILLVTLPFIVGATGFLVYLATGIEKLTGIELEKILKKKR